MMKCSMSIVRLAVPCCVWCLAWFAELKAEEGLKPRLVGWSDLKMEFSFEDPFAKLGEEQLLDLGMIARVQSLEKLPHCSVKVTEAMSREAAAARNRLEEKNVDVDGLFARRAEIAALRRKREGAAVPGLDGKLLALSGFVLPLEYQDKKVTEFLLVPWVGACIHTPPPPPNQIVHVLVKLPFKSKGLFEAVTVTGVMKISRLKKELYLVDGAADINMSYGMSGAAVTPFRK